MISQLPPASAAKSTITDPGFMAATISSVINVGAGRPGISAVVITMSTSLHCSMNSFISASMNSFDMTFA